MISLDPGAVLALRLGIAAIFAGALLHKFGRWQAFAGIISSYLADTPLQSRLAAGLVACLVVAAEGMAVVSALLPGMASTLPAAALLLIYAAAMQFNIARGNGLDCGCSWGAARQPISGRLVTRNLALAAGAFLATLPAARSPVAMDIVSAAGGAALLVVAYVIVNQLAANRQALEGAVP